MDLGPARPRWTFSRPALKSPHLERIRERLEFVRRYYDELEGITIHVGLAQKPGVLGWGSLDPDKPGVWVRPRRLDYFTIAHEFTHLLQARRLVPGGERACDLWALARSPLLVDTPPSYLRLPKPWRWKRRLDFEEAKILTTCARRAIVARTHGDRRYLVRFERDAAHGLVHGMVPDAEDAIGAAGDLAVAAASPDPDILPGEGIGLATPEPGTTG